LFVAQRGWEGKEKVVFVEEEVCASAKRLGRLAVRLNSQCVRQPDWPNTAVRRRTSALPQMFIILLHRSATPAKYHIMAETTQVSDDTEIFKQLESYPWEKDKEFQVSLYVFQFIISLGIKSYVHEL
jgi:superfamily II DNA helicase RecQ